MPALPLKHLGFFTALISNSIHRFEKRDLFPPEMPSTGKVNQDVSEIAVGNAKERVTS